MGKAARLKRERLTGERTKSLKFKKIPNGMMLVVPKQSEGVLPFLVPVSIEARLKRPPAKHINIPRKEYQSVGLTKEAIKDFLARMDAK